MERFGSLPSAARDPPPGSRHWDQFPPVPPVILRLGFHYALCGTLKFNCMVLLCALSRKVCSHSQDDCLPEELVKMKTPLHYWILNVCHWLKIDRGICQGPWISRCCRLACSAQDCELRTIEKIKDHCQVFPVGIYVN